MLGMYTEGLLHCCTEKLDGCEVRCECFSAVDMCF